MKNTDQLVLVNQLAESPITTELVASPEFEEQYSCLTALLNYLEDMKKNVDSAIKEKAREHYFATGEGSIENGSYKYTYVPEGVRETFNTKDFKAEHGDLYNQYVRVSNVSDSLRIYRVSPKTSTPKGEDLDN